MIKRPLRNLTAASILAGATHDAIAQTPMPQTPTTKILAVGTFAPGADRRFSAFCRPRFARPRNSISMARSTSGIRWKTGRVSSSS